MSDDGEETGERVKPVKTDPGFENVQLKAQKNELLAMVEELSFLENKLRESEAALKNAQQIAHLGSWTLDPAIERVTLSDEMLRIYGLDPRNRTFSYEDLKSRLHPDDGHILEEAIQKTLATGNGYELEHRVIGKDGVERTVLSRGYIRHRNDGCGTLLIGTSQDITERKRAEEALFHANKKLNMLSSITRHDVLNKLTALYAFLELSKEMVAQNPVLTRYLERELEVTEAIQRQIEFTRFYQDIGIRAPEWRDVETIIASAVTQLRPEGITVHATVHAVEVFADPLIEKVFYNLMENSLRHGGQVTSITVTGEAGTEGLVLWYQDDGIGIPSEDKVKLFQKGFGKHTGLGLFLSREILAITNITIREDGEPGKGVRFRIFVPKGAYRLTGADGNTSYQ